MCGSAAEAGRDRPLAVNRVYDCRPLLACDFFGLLSLMKGSGIGPYSPPPKGRPKLGELNSIDCRRAFRLWDIANNFNLTHRSNRDLISAARQLEQTWPGDEGLFPSGLSDATAEQSVTRGRQKLEITGAWQSELCDKIAAYWSQTTPASLGTKFDPSQLAPSNARADQMQSTDRLLKDYGAAAALGVSKTAFWRRVNDGTVPIHPAPSARGFGAVMTQAAG